MPRVPPLWLGAMAAALVVSAAFATPFALSPDVSAAAAVAPVSEPVSAVRRLPPAAPTPGKPAEFGPGTPAGDSSQVHLTVSGRQRSYVLLPGLGLRPAEPAGLLVVLHHDVATARDVATDLGLDGLRREGVTIAYPAGIGGSWNAGACCGDASDLGVDDVGFVNTVLDDVGRHTPIDPTRRALLGYSGGGMLLYRILCRPHPPLVAAVEVNGSLEAHCSSAIALPNLLSVHGADDGTVGLETSNHVKRLGLAPRSVRSTLAAVTSRGGCSTSAGALGTGLRRYADCTGGTHVDVEIVPDAGHGWEDVGGAARSLAFLRPHLTRPHARAAGDQSLR
ncbi:MAG TPA: hypothetical protein VNA30_05595 [Mycobacteriales bacterium]|nr:hypothetical protein [Mycobacteriales bacterium]